MKLHPHPAWLSFPAAALVILAAPAARADEMPVKPSLIQHKAKALPWTVAVDSKASGKVKIWDQDPFNPIAKLFPTRTRSGKARTRPTSLSPWNAPGRTTGSPSTPAAPRST